MEQCPPCVMAIHRNGRIETLQHTCRFDETVAPALHTGGTLSAHGRTDPATGERIHVSYRTDEPPCLCVDTFDPYWKRRRPQVTVELSAPIMLHDVCITPRHTCTVLFDFPLASVPIEPEHGARIGLLPPRTRDDETPLWFDCMPGVIHMVSTRLNARTVRTRWW